MKKNPGDFILLHMCTINENHMMYGSWNMRSNRHNFLSFWTIFCPFIPPWQPSKTKLLKNEEKKTSRYYPFTYVYHNNDHMMYGSWDKECNRQNFLSFIPYFALYFPPSCPPCPPLAPRPRTPNNQENQNFEKMRKTPYDIIILHMRDKNEDHMMHGSWDAEHDRQYFFLFWSIFCSFTPLSTWKIKILKKWEKPMKISFYTCLPKIMITYNAVPEIWHMMDVISIFHFGLFFTFLCS